MASDPKQHKHMMMMPKVPKKAPRIKDHSSMPDGSGSRRGRGDNTGAPVDPADRRWYGGPGAKGSSGGSSNG